MHQSESETLHQLQLHLKLKLDKSLNEIKLAAPDVITAYLRNDSEATKQALFLFSTIRKLERVGDLCKNIAEQLIFYAEAKVVKHRSEK